MQFGCKQIFFRHIRSQLFLVSISKLFPTQTSVNCVWNAWNDSLEMYKKCKLWRYRSLSDKRGLSEKKTFTLANIFFSHCKDVMEKVPGLQLARCWPCSWRFWASPSSSSTWPWWGADWPKCSALSTQKSASAVRGHQPTPSSKGGGKEKVRQPRQDVFIHSGGLVQAFFYRFLLYSRWTQLKIFFF